jgi:site-specific recombinase XerD
MSRWSPLIFRPISHGLIAAVLLKSGRPDVGVEPKWCKDRGLTLATIRPFDVSTYIESLQQTYSAPSVKQQLAAVRMLFDWLITGQIVPANPASAVRGPKHS